LSLLSLFNICSQLPEQIQISKDAKLAIAVAGKIFINYATACANDFCMASNRSTISGKDVIAAMEELELPEFIPKLEETLDAYKKEQAAKPKKEKEKDKKDKSNDDAK